MKAFRSFWRCFQQHVSTISEAISIIIEVDVCTVRAQTRYNTGI